MEEPKTQEEILALIAKLKMKLPFDLRESALAGCSICDLADYPEERAGEHNSSPSHRQWLKLGGKRSLTPEALALIEKGMATDG